MALAAATIAAGLVLTADTRAGLGTPLPPFLMNWAPLVRWPAVLAAAVALVAAWWAPRLSAVRMAPAVFAAAVYLLALGLGLSVNAARGGPSAWDHVFNRGPGGSFEASREYLPALGLLSRGVGYYVGHFAHLLPYLPTHAKGNPPGPVVVMHLAGITSASSLAAVCVGFGALTAPLAYGLGRALGSEQRGRLAAILTAFSPALILFGVTSVDYVFAALGTGVAWLLVCEGRAARATGCVLAGVSSFFSWLLPAVAAWAVLVVWRRRGWRSALVVAFGVAAGVVSINLTLALALGYDPIAVVRALAPIYRHGIAAHRPYPYWLFGSPVAWLVMLGVPTAWLALRSLAGADDTAVALAAVIAIAVVAGFTKAETERIWLPFVPLAAVAAAAAGPTAAAAGPTAAAAAPTRLRPVVLVLAVQAIAIELLFDTVW
jgi:methylthioxylose transferase